VRDGPHAVPDGAALPPSRRVAVAFSGGRDSLALLHACCSAAAALDLQVLAIHVHHGLMPQADAWLQSARRLVARWRRRGWPVALAHARLEGAPAAGESIEAWARAGRHAALQRLAREGGAGLLLLAQHRADQAETVLLQALRGAGPAGLAAMPQAQWRDGVLWGRPWLAQPRRAIDAYVLRHRLRPLEDPSNADARFARSRLRTQVMPVLAQGFPEAETALAAVATRAQQADAVLQEVAALDLAACCTPSGDGLWVEAWRRLSPARQANALRAWWWRRTGRGAPHTLIDRLLAELPDPSRADGRGPDLRRRACWPAVDGDQALLSRGRLLVQPALASRHSATKHTLPQRLLINLARPGRHEVPAWGGAFLVEACSAQGLSSEWLAGAHLSARVGGERFQIALRRPPRSLKKQYQALNVSAGPGRDGPLVWHGERLLYVPGLGVDARCWAAAGAPQWRLAWWPDPPVEATKTEAPAAARRHQCQLR
jgi:tRNA(Ile)-lysidine synthase